MACYILAIFVIHMHQEKYFQHVKRSAYALQRAKWLDLARMFPFCFCCFMPSSACFFNAFFIFVRVPLC